MEHTPNLETRKIVGNELEQGCRHLKRELAMMVTVMLENMVAYIHSLLCSSKGSCKLVEFLHMSFLSYRTLSCNYLELSTNLA